MIGRLALAWLVVVFGGAVARAAELPPRFGMYPASGPPLAMVESKVEIAVRGPLAEVTVTQRFHNRAAHATEATYIFPLPLDAAVSAMSIKVGDRTIRGAIERRAQAQRRYEDAVRAGVGAALLDQERPDVFTQTVAAIPAGGSVEVTLRFDTVAAFANATWELALPLVVAPRYVPGVATGRPTTGTGRAPDTDRAPDASRVTPGGGPLVDNVTTVVIKFADPVHDVTSPTHELSVAGAEATFRDPRSDHDAIVRWRSGAAAAGWVEQGPGGGYAAVLVEAPPAPERRGALRCLLVLDRSAVTHGDADAVMRPLVRALVGQLRGQDRIAVAGSDAIAWTAGPDAWRALEQAWATPAGPFDLTRVLGAARPGGAPIVLVTSGLVADDRAAIAAARKLGVPIHVIGVGPAPARGLLTQLAGATEGTARFAVPGDDLGALAKATLADVAVPPPPLTVTWGALAARDVVPGTLPRLGAGQAMLVLARVERAQPATRARGELFAIEVVPPPRRRRRDVGDGRAGAAVGARAARRAARRRRGGARDRGARAALRAGVAAHVDGRGRRPRDRGGRREAQRRRAGVGAGRDEVAGGQARHDRRHARAGGRQARHRAARADRAEAGRCAAARGAR